MDEHVPRVQSVNKKCSIASLKSYNNKYQFAQLSLKSCFSFY